MSYGTKETSFVSFGIISPFSATVIIEQEAALGGLKPTTKMATTSSEVSEPSIEFWTKQSTTLLTITTMLCSTYGIMLVLFAPRASSKITPFPFAR